MYTRNIEKAWGSSKVLFRTYNECHASISDVYADRFYRQMQLKPAPQLSEPGHGSLVQPALVAMRYPVIREGEFVNIVSMMIRTESFIEAVGLERFKAYEIICRGKLAEKKGELSDNPRVLTLNLPSTEWIIRYDNKKAK